MTSYNFDLTPTLYLQRARNGRWVMAVKEIASVRALAGDYASREEAVAAGLRLFPNAKFSDEQL